MKTELSEPPETIQAHLRNTVRFWELRRVAYNLVLTVVALAWVFCTWPHFRPALQPTALPSLLFLVIMANVCYFAAYPAEIFLKCLVTIDWWQRQRWILWLAGTLLGILLECYWIADEIYDYLQ